MLKTKRMNPVKCGEMDHIKYLIEAQQDLAMLKPLASIHMLVIVGSLFLFLQARGHACLRVEQQRASLCPVYDWACRHYRLPKLLVFRPGY
jgi:hypothetical protein